MATTSPPIESAKRVRLTALANCGGCAAKLSQNLLAEVLDLLAVNPVDRNADPNILVSADTFDDAGIYQLRPDLALVQTVDFFTPIVDDPYEFGQIAAANALSDVYAMGGRPITALNLLGVPPDKLTPQDIAGILRGGADKIREAGCALLGGHTIKTSEPIYGLSVTGTVHPQHILTNAAARPGDLLVLTKPLGTGIITTGIKRGMASASIADAAMLCMKRLNALGAELAERGLIRCATDITGFGLTGHLRNIVRASSVRAEVMATSVPVIGAEVMELIKAGCIPGGTLSNLRAADSLVDWGTTPDDLRIVLADAQTSGPLLLCVNPGNLEDIVKLLDRDQAISKAVIGKIVSGEPAIRVI